MADAEAWAQAGGIVLPQLGQALVALHRRGDVPQVVALQTAVGSLAEALARIRGQTNQEGVT